MNDIYTLVILGLGTARLTALVALDSITYKMRDMIWYWSPPEDDDRLGYFYQIMRRATKDERVKRRAGVKGLPWYDYWFVTSIAGRKPGFIGSAVACPLCISVWIAAANYASFLLWPDAILHINLFLALAFIGGFLASRWGK
jgi:hypothetical protein